MAYDQAGFTQRLLKLLPQSWSNDTAKSVDGGLYAFMNSLAHAPTALKAQIDYAQAQTRILTATDTNLEQIASDLFGAGTFPRALTLVGANLIPETDASYAARIAAEAVAPANTIAAIQREVVQYIDVYYTGQYVSNQQTLGTDATGGLDSRGALDGTPSSTPAIPKVYVFDRQSDLKLATAVGLNPGDFCVMLIYGGLTHDGFFLGRSHLGRGTHLLVPKVQIVSPLTPQLDVVVRATKAKGTNPVYADNRAA